MARELEVKMSLTAKAQEAAADWLLAQPGASAGEVSDLVNIYYDTPDGDLNRNAIALRVRQSGRHFIQTLKTRGEFVDGAHQRQEWEWHLPDARLNLGLIADTPACERINLALLQPVFETNFQRRTIMLRDSEADIECALDSGRIVAGNRTLALCELELELKAGADLQLLHWSRRLADHVPVFVNLTSKAEQGYYLAGLYQPGVPDVGADPVYRLLAGLSAAWLTGDKRLLTAEMLESVASEARAREAATLLAWLRSRLESGESLASLAEGLQIGQLQTRLVGPR